VQSFASPVRGARRGVDAGDRLHRKKGAG
jgi:hypothetical protein